MTRIPFAFDIQDGLTKIRGTVALEGDDLVIETRRALLDMIPYRKDTFRLPADEIASIDVERGMVSQKLVIELFSHELIDDFPGDPTDALALPIKRKHCDAADALARETRRRNLPR